MRTALAQLETTSPEDAVEADFAFHRAIADAAGNRFYLDLLNSLGPMMIMLPRTRLGDAHSPSEAEHVARVQREHAQVADAVAAGDAGPHGRPCGYIYGTRDGG